MKKKYFSVIMAVVCTMVCVFGLTACGEDPNVLEFVSPHINTTTDKVRADVDAKYAEYNITMTYDDGGVNVDGEIVAVNELKLWASYSNAPAKILSLKTEDNPDGYEIEGQLPDNPTVGVYSLNYLYDGWTVKVNYVVVKRRIICPYFLNMSYIYTGEEIKPELSYEGSDIKYVTYDLDYGRTDKGEYELTFSLKSPENCEWIDREGEEATAPRSIPWEIA